MKARMLMMGILLLASMAQGAEKIDFNGLINNSTTQGEKLNTRVVKQLPQAETVGFYNTEWLRLRQRKRFSVAQAEIRLKKAGPSSKISSF